MILSGDTKLIAISGDEKHFNHRIFWGGKDFNDLKCNGVQNLWMDTSQTRVSISSKKQKKTRVNKLYTISVYNRL